ncbi:membrane hypothetical protein [Gammaproteobacteria bacterium]
MIIFSHILFVGVLVNIAHHELLDFILIGTPGYAAFVATYLAQSWKIAVGLSMSVCAALVSIVSACLYEYMGFPIDHIGTLWTTFIILLVYYIPMGILGSTLGYVLSRSLRTVRICRRRSG